jgi:hypothetical protein
MILIAGSPLLLLWIVQAPLPWPDLGNAGQAYGAVSALVSGAALLAVGVSLLMQQRQTRTTEEQAVRQRHFDLVNLTLHDLKFLHSWGRLPKLEYDPALLGFANLIVNHWFMLWRINRMTETALRENARNFFAGHVGRDYWRRSGPRWPATDRANRTFAGIMRQEFDRAADSGPPESIPPSTEPPSRVRSRALYVAGAVSLIGAGYLIHRRRRSTSRKR